MVLAGAPPLHPGSLFFARAKKRDQKKARPPMARLPPIPFASRFEVARQRILRWLATGVNPFTPP